MSNATQMQPSGKPFTGWHMWAVMIAFFGVVIAVNVWMAVESQTSWTGMVTDDSYLAGQDYEANRKAHDAQQAEGWSPRFGFANGVASLTITDAAGLPVDLGEVHMLVNRPVGGHDDQNVILTRAADGTYSLPLTLAAGTWEVTITADTRLGFFETTERFKVDGPAK